MATDTQKGSNEASGVQPHPELEPSSATSPPLNPDAQARLPTLPHCPGHRTGTESTGMDGGERWRQTCVAGPVTIRTVWTSPSTEAPGFWGRMAQSVQAERGITESNLCILCLPPSLSLCYSTLTHPTGQMLSDVKATSNLVVISTMKNNCLWWNCWHSGSVRRPFEKPCQGPVFVI